MRELRIGSHTIGEGHPPFVIAEIGINHQGDVEIARQLIDAAADAGADAVKFQKRAVRQMMTQAQLDEPYTGPNSFGRTYGEHRDALELSVEDYRALQAHARWRGLVFFASAWDFESIALLRELNIPAFKVASADLTNHPMLEHLARGDQPLLLSTGMSSMAEIEQAVRIVRRHTDRFALLQCTAAYPAPDDELNLRVIPLFRQRFNCVVGYSGHELGIGPTIAAVALGADIIERHLTLDRRMKGSDHAASLEPHELRLVIEAIHQARRSLGQADKRIWSSELPNRRKLAKSIVASRPIRCGQQITEEMLTVKSPGTGISPSQWSMVIGRTAARDIPPDCQIHEEDLIPLYTSVLA